MAKSPKERRGSRGKPVSLHPLALKDALAALVKTPPVTPARRRSPPAKKKR
ncbi:MAG: hypothetical protein HKM95_17750 [Inquilinus sp.]|nr:hypothetical protein [Inquilinus sp.]